MLPRALAALLAGAGVLALAACGSDDDNANTPPPVARPQDFPQPAGRRLGELIKQFGPEGPVLSPAVSELEPGTNRFGFGLFDRSRRQIADAPVALYLAPAVNGRVTTGKVEGPFTADYESLSIKGPYQSQTVAKDADTAKSVYVAKLKFPKPGQYAVIGVARLDDRLVNTGPVSVVVKKDSKVPRVGEAAPKIDTPTSDDVGGDLKQIDTRTPATSMHEQSFRDVVGKKPTVLLFATPSLCQSRVCGPVADITEQVKQERGNDDVAFVHMEIFQGNEIKQGCLERKRPLEECFREQVIAYNLPTEPWLFTVDRNGRVAARVEGAFSERELKQAIAKAGG